MAQDVNATVGKMREYFGTQVTKPYEFRIGMLRSLRKAIKRHEGDIFRAFIADYNKHEFDTFATELSVTYGELDYALKHLKSWMTPEKKWAGFLPAPGYGKIYRDPYGVNLVVSPWNYPFHLSMVPLIGSISGENCTCIKPSNYSRNVSDVIKTICEEAFPSEYVSVILGGRESNAALFEQNFDFVFFTGGTTVGKLLLEKQSAHVTPVVLELGGKSPVIVTGDADLKYAAKHLVWGKFVNSGQTCVAPDYVLVDEKVHDEFVSEVISVIKKMYYKNGKLMDTFVHMISDKHFAKVCSLIDEQRIVFGGRSDAANRLLEPTVLDNVQLTDKIMSEEIFGPVLPFITYSTLDEAIGIVDRVGHIYNGEDGAKPLALYCFTRNKKDAEKVLISTSSGGACINDTILHVGGHRMPFCGVGYSGMGFGYHGKTSFDAFTHNKSVLYNMSPSRFQIPAELRFSNAFMDSLMKPMLSAGVDRLLYLIF
jgi:aldehyde dehydrogenase (NAD+)